MVRMQESNSRLPISIILFNINIYIHTNVIVATDELKKRYFNKFTNKLKSNYSIYDINQ